MKIATNTVVSIRYKMKNGKGDVLEDIQSGAPIEYVHGAGKILPQLEASLVGLVAGDKKEISISGSGGYQQVDEEFLLDVVVDDVRAATKEEIEKGQPHREKVESCGPGCNC